MEILTCINVRTWKFFVLKCTLENPVHFVAKTSSALSSISVAVLLQMGVSVCKHLRWLPSACQLHTKFVVLEILERLV